MAHEIQKVDIQQGREMAWHNLTQIKTDLSIGNCWLNDWDVEKRKLFLEGNIETDYHLLVASDDPKIKIGVPFADSYVPITNSAFIDCISDAISGIDGLQLESAGSIMGRNRVFASFSISKANFTSGNRDFEAFLNFSNAHDKGTPFLANTSNTCIICSNTYNANLRHKGKNVNVRVRHTKNASIKLENIEEIVAGALGAQAEFKTIFDSLADIKTNEKEARQVFAGFIGGGSEMSTRSINTVDRLTGLFNRGAGNKGENRSDIFSACTDYYSHESSGGENRMKQFVSSEFGSGANKKREFLNLIDTEFDTLVKKGELSLSLS